MESTSLEISKSDLTLDWVIQSARIFLLNARNSRGWWTDFQLAPGFSDEWVTGYVGTMLANLPEEHVKEAQGLAWNLLKTRCHRANKLWSYNYFPPGDADSTGWALQLARLAGEHRCDRALQAMQSLSEHQRSNGGFSTYARSEPIRAFICAPQHQSMEGWCSAHVCVSAALAALPEFCESLQPYLHATQTSQGNWLAYWWHDHEYVTALAAEAIADCNPNSEAVSRAVNWAVYQVRSQGFVATNDHPAGSPFATAWCLRLLLLGHSSQARQHAIAVAHWLVSQQQHGAWESSARLRVPYPDDIDPNQPRDWIYGGKIQGSLVLDQHRIFTTATVLQALVRFRAKGWE